MRLPRFLLPLSLVCFSVLAHAAAPYVPNIVPMPAPAGQPATIYARVTDPDGDITWVNFHYGEGAGWPLIQTVQVPAGTVDTWVSINWTPPSPTASYTIHVAIGDATGLTHGQSGQPWPSAPLAPATGTFEVGTLPGDLSVDNKGSANYSIPLALPPGRGGMQPSLALSYNSNAGNGTVGIGWSLSTGFPQGITRGRTILARDNKVKGVTYDDTHSDVTLRDKFYLDGKRLICISGTYGSHGSSYRTEVDSFVTITATGTTGNIEIFTATDKTGTRMIFGKHTGASGSLHGYQVGFNTITSSADTKAYTYALRRVEDVLGNGIDFEYESHPNGEYVLNCIKYTGNTPLGILPLAKVKFEYDLNVVPGSPAGVTARRDKPTRYVAGRRFDETKRLDRIVSEFSGTSGVPVVSRYDLEYGYAPNYGPTRLGKIRPYLRNPSSDLLLPVQPTVLAWEETPPSYTNLAAPLLPSSNSPDRFAFGDVNGDGKDDFIDFGAAGGVQVSLSTGSGFGAPGSGLWTTHTGELHKLCDINGDGLKDIVYGYLRGLAPTPKIYALVSNGTQFVPLDGSGTPAPVFSLTSEFLDPPPDGGTAHIQSMEGASVNNRITLADFTGDGRDDILIHRYDGKLQVLKSNGTSFTALPLSNVGANSLWGIYSNANPVTVGWVWAEHAYFMFHDFSVSMMPCELNGDGITDYAWVETKQNVSEWDGSFGSGQSVVAQKQLFAVRGLPGGGFSSKEVVDQHGWTMSSTGPKTEHRRNSFMITPGDVNGDGLTDFTVLFPADSVDASVYEGWTPGLAQQRILRRRVWYSTGSSTLPAFKMITVEPGTNHGRVNVGGQLVFPFWDKVPLVRWVNDYYNSIAQIPNVTQKHIMLASGLTSSSDNVTMADLNYDGRQDYVWYSATAPTPGWYVMYSLGETFSDPVAAPINWIASSPLPPGGQSMPTSSRSSLDLNGDGVTDYAYDNNHAYSAAPGVVGVHLSSGKPGVRLLSVMNGLGGSTGIAYRPITDNTVYTPGVVDIAGTAAVEGVTYPIRELRNASYVVSDVFKDSGGTATAQFSYQYSGNRLDLSGRGPLGFHSFVTLDRQTNLFKYQFLAQSFPMTGLTHREQTYRYWTSGPNVNFRIISSHDNTVVFDEVVASLGGTAYGTVYPFMSSATESRWEDGTTRHYPATGQGEWAIAGSSESKAELLFTSYRSHPPVDAHITISARSWFDEQLLGSPPQSTLPAPFLPGDTRAGGENVVVGVDYFPSVLTPALMPRKITHGNLRQLKTDFGDGFSESVSNIYLPPSTNGLTGRLESVTTTVTSPNGATETAPVKKYTYWTYGITPTPLVEVEEIDAVDPKFDLKTKSIRPTSGARQWRVTETQIQGYNKPGHEQHIGGFYTVSNNTAYDDRFDLPTMVENAYTHRTSTVYDAVLGQPTTVTDVENNAPITNTYDALGRVIKVRDDLKALEKTTAFGSATAPPAWMVDIQPVAVPTSPPSGFAGLVLTPRYAVRQAATVQPTVIAYYDRLGRTIRTVKDGYGSQKTVADTIYNVLGQVVAVSIPYLQGTAPSAIKWSYTTYDPLGRVATVTTPSGTGAGHTVVTSNQYIGRATKVTVTPSVGTPQVNTTVVDAKGRTVKVWNTDNVPTSLDVWGTPTPTLAPSIEYKLDGFGRMRATVLKGQTQPILATYDELGRQTSLHDPDKGPWYYTNNALGQVVRQLDANGNITRSTFDRLGRPLTRITAEPSTGPAESASWFYYDKVADVLRHAVAPMTATLGSPPRTFKSWIGALEREESVTIGAPGYAAAAAATVSTQYYDEKGRAALSLTTIDGKWFYTDTSYRELSGADYSRVNQVRHYWRQPPNESPTVVPADWKDWGYTYTYDGSGTASKSYVLRMQDTNPSPRTWWEAHSTAGYDHLDRPVLVRKGAGHWTKRDYRVEDGVLTTIKTGSLSGTVVTPIVQNLTFGYDGLGNLTSRSINVGALSPLPAINRSESFVYDNLNRLTASTVTGQSARVTAYATNGNITSKSGGDGSSSTYTYDALKPHAVATAFNYTMAYDANGNMVTRSGNGKTWYTRWAGFDKPRWLAMDSTGTDFTSGVVGSEFIYNANRSRVVHLEFDSMTGPGPSGVPAHYTRKRLYAFGSTLEVDYTNSAAGSAQTWNLSEIRVSIPAPEGIIGAREYKITGPVEEPKVYHSDHLGSIECVTAHGNTVILHNDDAGKPARFSSDPWGERRDPTDWLGKPVASVSDDGGANSATPRGFTGHEMLDDLGLVHMNGRIYDALLGRMLSADLFVPSPADLQSYNRFSYVSNRPLTLVDPSGYKPKFLQDLEDAADAVVDSVDRATSGGTDGGLGLPDTSPTGQVKSELRKLAHEKAEQIVAPVRTLAEAPAAGERIVQDIKDGKAPNPEDAAKVAGAIIVIAGALEQRNEEEKPQTPPGPVNPSATPPGGSGGDDGSGGTPPPPPPATPAAPAEQQQREKTQRMTDSDSPAEQLEGVEQAQTQAQKDRPQVQGPDADPDWEGDKKRPRQSSVESTKKSEQRARKNNYTDDDDDSD